MDGDNDMYEELYTDSCNVKERERDWLTIYDIENFVYGRYCRQ